MKCGKVSEGAPHRQEVEGERQKRCRYELRKQCPVMSWVEVALDLRSSSTLADRTAGKKALALKLVGMEAHSLLQISHSVDLTSRFTFIGEKGANKVEKGEGACAQKRARMRLGDLAIAVVKIWQKLPKVARRARFLASIG
jgi:hypothetical protein